MKKVVKMKTVVIILSLFISTLIMNSCGVLSNDTWYDIGYDIGRAISVNTNEEETPVVEQNSIVPVGENN